MAGNIVIRPKEFEKEVEDCKSSGIKVDDVKLDIDFPASEMEYLDKFVSCGLALNQIIAEFKKMIQNDMICAEKVKGEWMNVDDDLANKTFGELVSEFKKGK